MDVKASGGKSEYAGIRARDEAENRGAKGMKACNVPSLEDMSAWGACEHEGLGSIGAVDEWRHVRISGMGACDHRGHEAMVHGREGA